MVELLNICIQNMSGKKCHTEAEVRNCISTPYPKIPNPSRRKPGRYIGYKVVKSDTRKLELANESSSQQCWILIRS